jgi:hypothetical protein
MAQKKDCLYKESPSMLVLRYSRSYPFNAALPLLFVAPFFGIPLLMILLMALFEGAVLFVEPQNLFLFLLLFAPTFFCLWVHMNGSEFACRGAFICLD